MFAQVSHLARPQDSDRKLFLRLVPSSSHHLHPNHPMHKTSKSQPLRHEIRSLWAWESPVRRSGHCVLQHIPAEIYLVIFAYLRPRYDRYGTQRSDPKSINDLRSLSLVCRYFCAEILPWLFESVAFCPNLSKDATGDARASYISFCNSINRDEEFSKSLAIYIKHCSIRNWYDVSEIAGKAFLNLYIETLPNFVNLTTVSLSRMRLTPPLLAHIRRLQCLISLSIDRCNFADILAKHVPKLASRCKLRSFCLYTSEVSKSGYTPDSSILKEFLPMFMPLSDLRTDSWQLVQLLISSDTTPPKLEILDLHDIQSLDDTINCVDVLNEYLYRLPALASLTVTLDDSYLEDQDSSLLSLYRLQNLRYLCCPDYVLSKETILPDKLDDLDLAMIGINGAWEPITFLESFGLWPGRNQLIKLTIPHALVSDLFIERSTRIVLERLQTLVVIIDHSYEFRRGIQKSSADDIEAMVMSFSGTLEWIIENISMPNLQSTRFRRLRYRSEDWIWKKDESTGQWIFVGKDEEVDE
ncbi:hypothetical protein EV360DRAFT_88668 [Lentinula raphanica]|nr:hypothetical protein EV360DRAFT_88668 [Lentinula raphanica]